MTPKERQFKKDMEFITEWHRKLYGPFTFWEKVGNFIAKCIEYLFYAILIIGAISISVSLFNKIKILWQTLQ